MPAKVAVVVLAAGKGTRMKSDRAKVLHPVAWRPMLAHVLDATASLDAAKRVVIVGHRAAEVRDAALSASADRTVEFAEQREQKGTGHAVQQAKDALAGFDGTVLVLPGDVPLIRTETLRDFLAFHEASGAPVSVLTTNPPDATGYGRIVRASGDRGAGAHPEGSPPGARTGDPGRSDRIARIVEHKDCTDEQLTIAEINSGFIAADAKFLFSALEEIRPENSQKELYLTDVIGIAARRGTQAAAFHREGASEFEGINDRAQLATQEAALFKRVASALMASGVTILHPHSVRIDPRARVGVDTLIHPRVEIRGACFIGEECTIDTGSVIEESVLGRGVLVKPYCVITRSRAADSCILGPYAHLRPEADLAEGVHVGNFVEVKKSTIGRGSKANHLAYLGDATIGAGVNVGAGTITCNYDGFLKHQTVIEDGVFIGSDTQLVAPVTVGKDAVIGAGTTVTKNVSPGALALTRSKQIEIEGYAAKHRARGEKAKAEKKKGSK